MCDPPKWAFVATTYVVFTQNGVPSWFARSIYALSQTSTRAYTRLRASTCIYTHLHAPTRTYIHLHTPGCALGVAVFFVEARGASRASFRGVEQGATMLKILQRDRVSGDFLFEDS